jgi:hypothetical protein
MILVIDLDDKHLKTPSEGAKRQDQLKESADTGQTAQAPAS